MNEPILFEEHQDFEWISLISTSFLLIVGIINFFVNENYFDYLFYFLLIGIVLYLVFKSISLKTQIKSDGIYVKFFPFHFRYQFYPWDLINKSFIRKYSPFFEYGGWGFRFGLFGKGRAYNVSGNIGLQIEFTDNRKLLIGTKKATELEECLKNLNKINE